MAYAVTHVIIAIVLISLYRHYIAKKKFSNWYVLIGGIAGLLPDIDVPIQWTASAIARETIEFHRIWTHSLLCVAVFLLVALIFWMQKHKKFKMFKREWTYEQVALLFTIIAAGWFIHIALDCGLASDYNLTIIPGVPMNFCPHPFSRDTLLGIDAIILILWLIHEEYRHNIKEFT